MKIFLILASLCLFEAQAIEKYCGRVTEVFYDSDSNDNSITLEEHFRGPRRIFLLDNRVIEQTVSLIIDSTSLTIDNFVWSSDLGVNKFYLCVIGSNLRHVERLSFMDKAKSFKAWKNKEEMISVEFK